MGDGVQSSSNRLKLKANPLSDFNTARLHNLLPESDYHLQWKRVTLLLHIHFIRSQYCNTYQYYMRAIFNILHALLLLFFVLFNNKFTAFLLKVYRSLSPRAPHALLTGQTNWFSSAEKGGAGRCVGLTKHRCTQPHLQINTKKNP